ncbi:MAG: hypothetical protein K6E21_06320 [Bacilli bacterium]|nr:hypothetical protein [Bacilli bacterium]
MKTKKLLLIPLIALLGACGAKDTTTTTDEPKEEQKEERKLSVISPAGAPAVAMSYLLNSEKASFETTSKPALLKGYFAAKTYDVIVAPTDVGIKAIQEGCDYKLAATVTNGNFYLAATGEDTDGTLNAGDNIVLFQQGGLPDKIFHYIYGTDFDANITYVPSVAEAGTAYGAKEVSTADGTKVKADYVLLSEPKVTALNVTAESLTDLSAAFETKSQTSKIFQASVFVINNKEPEVGNFLAATKENIEAMLADTTKMTANMSKTEDPQAFFGIPPQMAKKITDKNNGLAITYMPAKDNKEAIKSYMNILGVQGVNDEVFYQ